MRNALIGILLLVGACASPYAVPLTPQQQVYEMQLQLDAVVAEVDAYASQPPCSETIVVGCYDPHSLARVVTALDDADLALDEAEAIVRAGGSSAAVSIYVSVARAALARAAAALVEAEGRQQ